MGVRGLQALLQFSSRFSSFAKTMQSKAEKAISSPSYELFKRLQANSPVDTGYYRSRWQYKSTRSNRRTRGANNLAQIRMDNDTPYGIYLEIGSIPGSYPWPQAKPRPVGKTVYVDGRIWSDTSPGGVMNKSIQEVPINVFVESVKKEMLDSWCF